MSSRLGAFLGSSIGKKTLMSLTGLGLVVFLIAHLAGNLTLYADGTGETYAAYAQKLKDLGPGLWFMELGLAAMFVAHIALAFRTSMENREARKSRYRVRGTKGEANLPNSSMLITGTVVLVFLVIHLLDFRFSEGLAPPHADVLAPKVVDRLASFTGAAIYLIGGVAVLIHLGHAFRSALRTLGVHHPQYENLIKRTGTGLAVALGLGFVSFPVILFASPDNYGGRGAESAQVAPAEQEQAPASGSPTVPTAAPAREEG